MEAAKWGNESHAARLQCPEFKESGEFLISRNDRFGSSYRFPFVQLRHAPKTTEPGPGDRCEPAFAGERQ